MQAQPVGEVVRVDRHEGLGRVGERVEPRVRDEEGGHLRHELGVDDRQRTFDSPDGTHLAVYRDGWDASP